jgi:hypothetical protein
LHECVTFFCAAIDYGDDIFIFYAVENDYVELNIILFSCQQ